MKNLICIGLLFLSAGVASPARCQLMPEKMRITIKHIKHGFPISEISNASWKRAAAVDVDKYWDGQSAPEGRRFTARMLWSNEHLYVRFEARQGEPLVISERPETRSKTMNLWDRDVCEIFLAPDKDNPRKYFEFEVAPTGEWLDVALDATRGKRISDWDYSSRMESAAKIGKGEVTMAIKVPWAALGRSPGKGDIWFGNLFRCVGKDPGRGYLAWSPTMTDVPNFHVPERFGEFVFVDPD